MRWVLECDTLGKRFGVRWVFRGLSLRAESGTVVVVQGGNGSGKSTLLRIVAGLTAPTEGRGDFTLRGAGGRDADGLSGLVRYRRRAYREADCL